MRKLASTVALMLLLSTRPGAASDTVKPVDDATKAKVRKAIESYVANDVRLKKFFFLRDPRSNVTLRLIFDHVHEGVSSSPKGYVACVDFKDRVGKIYDVDLTVSLVGESARMEEIALHKVNGKPIPRRSKESK